LGVLLSVPVIHGDTFQAFRSVGDGGDAAHPINFENFYFHMFCRKHMVQPPNISVAPQYEFATDRPAFTVFLQ